ncbi:MAG: hypothetical protein Q4F33_03435 [Mycoplasmatota bacterium]|nr:hypothetical protein [Mycoplasmatota bacterium]
MSRDNNHKEELTELEKMFTNISQEEERMAKSLNLISSVSISLGLSSLLSGIIGFNGIIETISFLTASTVLMSPIIYYGADKLKKRLDKKTESDIHHAAQLGIMLRESFEKDRIINRMTSCFFDEIEAELIAKNIPITEKLIYSINQFLYLINCNYYEKITPNKENFDREDLMNHVLSQISFYLVENNLTSFNPEIAQKVLETDFLVKPELKKEIYEEFTSSRVTSKDYDGYHIKRNDTVADIYCYQILKNQEGGDKYMGFDIDDGNDYYNIIKSLEQSKYFLENNLGDPRNLDWDIDFLRTIIKTIIRDHRQELKKTIPDFQAVSLAGSFIYNAMVYATVNNREQVHQEELINTFKNWTYLPFFTRKEIVDTLFEEQELSSIEHPFKTTAQQKTKTIQKIIPFPSK